MTSLRKAAAVLAVLAAVTLAGCTNTGHGPAAAKPDVAASQPPCQDSIADGCRELSVGGRDYRYYVSPPPSGATGEALLVDLGGPGISLSSLLPPNYGDSFRKDLGPIADGKTLLLVEEPWVSGKADPACRESSTAFYAWARQNWRTMSAATAPQMTCPWGQGTYGWNATTYRNVIQAITGREQITGVDMAAISFGAVRYTYISDLVGHVTLVRPAAAPGTNSDTVVEARTRQVWKDLVARCAGCTAGTVKRVVADTVRRYAGTTTELPDRSVPVNDFDIASGLAAAGISTADITLSWTSATHTVDLRTAAQLSDALWMRIGEQSVSPALVAYTDEYCQAYPAGHGSTGDDPIRAILNAPNLCNGRQAQTPVTTKPVDCLIIGADDSSAPADLAATWKVNPGGITSVSTTRRHWFTDTARCAKEDK
ncbi:hypothetical protein [Actinoplanes sp. NPDC020271]|uniref:hypothetical protein n=1 Tax=Actinoplanes sp. NPDC020271 TaxID=3363896 RepID=UPI0037A0543C